MIMSASTPSVPRTKSVAHAKSERTYVAQGAESKLSVENRLTIAACLLSGKEPRRGEIVRLARRFSVSRKTICEWRDRMSDALFRDAGRPPKPESQRRADALERENGKLREEIETAERRLAEYEAASGGKR